MRDPVCGRTLKKDEVKGTSTVNNCTYSFCSEECKQKFDWNPRGYLSDSALGA